MNMIFITVHILQDLDGLDGLRMENMREVPVMQKR